jgi:ABC-type nitrate/sulfonate/bicarbonate transport system substrate-binding protein
MKNNIKKLTAIMLVIALFTAMGLLLAACNDDPDETQAVRFVMPDGTPALAAARLFTDNKTLDGYDMDYEIVAASSLATELNSGKADILIMPTNAGVKLIKANSLNYKLVSVNVEGSLFVVGKPESVDTAEFAFETLVGKTVALIGKGGTPELVFDYIAAQKNITVNETQTKSDTAINVIFVDEASQAKRALANGTVDFAVVGQPAATAFATPNGGGYSEQLNLQPLYAQFAGQDNFPQAAMFVKSSLVADTEFMSALSTALEASAAWVNDSANAASITAYMQSQAVGSASAFPPKSIPKCNIVFDKIDTDAKKTFINAYLSAVGAPNADSAVFAY